MPYFTTDGQDIHFDDIGAGELIIATHGMMSPGYWAITGVAGVLGLKRRVAALDLRGHGRTRATEGFDVETMARDIGALADHLKVERFHLLGHATGGMVAMRYAMRHSERLHSLIVMDTSAQTAPLPPEHFDAQASVIEKTSAAQLYDVIDQTPAAVFQSGLNVLSNAANVRAMSTAMFAANNPTQLGKFMRTFYTDPNAREELLGEISCPALCMVGEHDLPFHAPIKFIADNIPRGEHIVVPGINHHAAFESPITAISIIEEFLERAEIAR